MPRPPRPLEPGRSVRHYAGAELRAWRLRRGLSQEQLGGLVHISGAFIGKLEKAERLCTEDLSTALDQALHADGSVSGAWHHAIEEHRRQSSESDGIRTTSSGPVRQTGAYETMDAQHHSSPEEPVTPVDRRDFLRAMPVIGVPGITAGLLEQIQQSTMPHHVNAADIAHIRSVARFFNAWDYSHGGTPMRETVSAEIARAMRLLSISCPETLRPPLFSAVGYLAVAGGALLFDGFEHDLARRVLAFATECAEQAGDWQLRAKSLSWRARQEAWIGNPDAGLTYAQLGLVRGDRLTPKERAMLHIASARTHAKLGHTQDTMRSIGRADEEFSAAKESDDPPWMAYYDKAQHSGDTGHALFDLAIHGAQVSEAVDRLGGAIAGHGDDYARSRAFSGLKLATLTMRVGDPREAVAVAEAALHGGEEIHSRRLDQLTEELLLASARHRSIPDVAQFIRSVHKEAGHP
jgi:hypothetical protein